LFQSSTYRNVRFNFGNKFSDKAITSKKIQTATTSDQVQERDLTSLLYLYYNRPKEVKIRGGKAPYAGNALKVMPVVSSLATFYDRERP
jgi:hypothetical protein